MPKIKLFLSEKRGVEIPVDGERILANNPIFPGEFNPHNVRLWVIGNEFGTLGAVWADCEQDAFDTLVDEGLGGGLLVDEKDANEECARLGNAGEPADLTHAWINAVRLSWEHDAKLIAAFAEARGAGAENLYFADTMPERWTFGCGDPTHVIGTNGGTMPCGSYLTDLTGKTARYFCGQCQPAS